MARATSDTDPGTGQTGVTATTGDGQEVVNSTGTPTTEAPATTDPVELPAGHAAGADGKPKTLHLVDFQDSFGPIEVPGSDVTYTLTRAGTQVAGEHVEHVRALAKHCGIQLRTTAATT